MSAAATVTMEALRGLLAGLAQVGKREVSTRQLAEVLGLEDEPAKARLRRRLQDLVRQRDLERVRDGVWRWAGRLERVKTGDVYQRLWRAIRASKPGYDAEGLAVVANACVKLTRSYLGWLAEEGLVERHGAKGNTRLYRTSAQGRETRATPWPPKPQADPYQTEKTAALGIMAEMLAGDLDQPARRRRIAARARQLLARFDREESHAEGPAETEEAADAGAAAEEERLVGSGGPQGPGPDAAPGA